jgi:DNA-binding GntR family transcriptional regulator
MEDIVRNKANLLAEQVYAGIKENIFCSDVGDCGSDRFTETEMAERFSVSRTPVRDALYRLEREGYLRVSFRSGWSVRPFDFTKFEELYDLRIILELAAVQQICETEGPPNLTNIKAVWLVPVEQRLSDPQVVAQLDEAFHEGLVRATGNREMARVHGEITERIRVIRRLDFTKPKRISTTYDEHAQILRLLLRRKEAQAVILLRSHIEASKLEVRKMTLHMLHEARETALQPAR